MKQDYSSVMPDWMKEAYRNDAIVFQSVNAFAAKKGDPAKLVETVAQCMLEYIRMSDARLLEMAYLNPSFLKP